MVAFVEPLAADDPRQVGGFRLQARLGAGGMGRVYLGYSPGGRPEIGRICFVQDPDGYRIELIDGGEFKTPQDA